MDTWKPIPGYEECYEASFDGHIRSVPGKVTSNARYKTRVWQSRVLKEKVSKNKKGRTDARVDLWKDGKHKTFLVSRLVALAWHGIPAVGMTVNHINGDTLDNSADNLEWITLSENIKRGFEDGAYSSKQRCIALYSDELGLFRFDSLSNASRWLGRTPGYLSNCLNKSHTIRDVGGREFKAMRYDNG